MYSFKPLVCSLLLAITIATSVESAAVIVRPATGFWYWNTSPNGYYGSPYANWNYSPYTGGYYRPGVYYRNYGMVDPRSQYTDPTYYQSDPRYGDKAKVFMQFGDQGSRK